MMGIERMNGCYEGICAFGFPLVPTRGTVDIDTAIDRSPGLAIVTGNWMAVAPARLDILACFFLHAFGKFRT